MTDAFWTGLFACVAASISAWLAYLARRDVAQVKHSVNSERSAMRREIADLKEAAQAAAVESARAAAMLERGGGKPA